MNGADVGQSNGVGNARRPSQRSANGNGDDTNSPISRTGTPNMYAAAAHPLYQNMTNLDDQFQAQQLASFGVTGTSPGRATSPLNGERLDIPPTHEQLIAANASLKTRVSELEVIQELYRGRIQQLEQEETMRQQGSDAAKADEHLQLREQVVALTETTDQLQKDLQESHHRENMLKRRLDELTVELKEAKESAESQEKREHKKPRLDEGSAITTDSASDANGETE